MATPWDRPIPAPTPYQSSEYGGSPYLVSGVTGEHVPASAFPQSTSGAYTQFSSGAVYPSSTIKVQGAAIQPQTQPQAQTPTVKSPPSGGSSGGNAGAGPDYNALISAMTQKGHSVSSALSALAGRGYNELAQEYLGGGGGEGGGGSISTNISEEDVNWVFQDLDKLAGTSSEWKENMKAQVENLAEGQKAEAGSSKETAQTKITGAETSETQKTEKTLRELAENARMLMDRMSALYGGGSPAEAVMTGIGKQVSKLRGEALTARDAVLSELNQKSLDVDRTFDEQIGNIGRWKDQKLLEIGEKVQGWLNEIATQKANVRASMKESALAAARNELANLQSMKTQYEYTMDTWREQRKAELEDYKTKLDLAAQYTASTGGTTNISDLIKIVDSSGQPMTINYGGQTVTLKPQSKVVKDDLGQFYLESRDGTVIKITPSEASKIESQAGQSTLSSLPGVVDFQYNSGT